MTGMAGAVARADLDITPVVCQMLEKIKHRGGDGFALAHPGLLQECASTDDFDPAHSPSSLGVVNRKSVFDDQIQPIEEEGYYLVFDGRLVRSGSLPDVVYSAEVVNRHPKPCLEDIIVQERGAFAVAVLSGSRLLLGRDSIGTVPAYLGQTRDFFAVATEKKALWEVGASAVRPLPPGHIVELSSNGVSVVPMNPLELPPIRSIPFGQLVRVLERVSHKAFDAALRKVEQVAVGYSGGLDSSLAAYLAADSGVEVDLISVGLESSRDLTRSQDAAEAMDLSFVSRAYLRDDLEATLDEAIYLAESPNPMQVQIAVPILWAAKAAAERGHRWLVLGQGCDELFGGYQKYQNRFITSGGNSARELMFSDIITGSETNFVRDNKLASSQGIELVLPFLSRDFVEVALSIPAEYKLGEGDSLERKMILRELAKKIGLPNEVTHRRKDAIQYSTGVSQALHRLARQKGFTLSELTHHRFLEVFGGTAQRDED